MEIMKHCKDFFSGEWKHYAIFWIGIWVLTGLELLFLLWLNNTL